MLQRALLFALALLAFAMPRQAVAAASCADRYVTARAVDTPRDLEAFVQCAREYVREHGTAEARRAFHEDERWRHGPIYVFVSHLAPRGEDATTYVHPADPSREGRAFGALRDMFGPDYYSERHRVLSAHGSGWVYYSFTNPETGLVQPKQSYQIAIDWNGEPAAIGAGMYRRDLPGTCEPSLVNAAALEADPSDQALEEFVRCATMEVESLGYFAGQILTRDPRWLSGSIYVFIIEVETEAVKYSANPSSFAVSGRIGEALFEGRDIIAASDAMGESYWYYSFTDLATGQEGRKVSFVKRVLAQGVPVLVGSGYYLGSLEGSQ